MNGDIPPCEPFNKINYLLIRAQEGMTTSRGNDSPC